MSPKRHNTTMRSPRADNLRMCAVSRLAGSARGEVVDHIEPIRRSLGRSARDADFVANVATVTTALVVAHATFTPDVAHALRAFGQGRPESPPARKELT